MKLSTLTAKLTCIRRSTVPVLAAATLAIAALAAATPAAQAQHFAVGVQIGGPRYYAPAPPPRIVYGHIAPAYGYGPGFYDHRRWEERQAFVRHEEWAHDRYYRHGYYR